MNGNNTNGSNNGGSCKTSQNPYESVKWQVGLINESGKFLTAEPFGFKLNVSATSLKQRQIWTVVPDAKADGVQLKSHLNRFLCADKDGLVTCEEEEVTSESCFLVEYCPKGSGGWAFKSQEHGLYLTGSGDIVSCFSKSPVWWTIRLAVHPQVHLRNLNRQRYLRLEDDEIHGNQTLPWGYDSLITLEHREGRVAVRTRDMRYLERNGALVENTSDDTLYNLEMHGGALQGLAFRDKEGKYLTLIGSTATMKSKNKTVGKDEIFIMEDSYAQVGLCAWNGKYASIKQGVDLYANQSELEQKETFQLEFQTDSSKWRLRTCEGKLWTISKDKSQSIKGSGNDQDPNTNFDMEYHDDGYVTFKAANNLYVSSKKLGLVSASGETANEEERFRLVLVNRPIMVFRCDYGYLGARSGRVECNFVNYEAFTLEHSPSTGHYTLKVSNGDYWELADNGGINLARGGDAPVFSIQFHTRTHLAILAPNGKFLRGEQNGQIRADADEVAGATLWEY